jgi:penicillin-binding protein 2
VERVEDTRGKIPKEYPPLETGRADISESTLHIIQQSLMDAVNDPHGTGWACAMKEVKAAGKTGTAQVIKMAQDFKKGDMNRMPLKFRDHAWFVAYAPVENPQISIAVLVEHGGFGGAVAAPIAKKVFEKFFNVESSSLPKVAGRWKDPEDDD